MSAAPFTVEMIFVFLLTLCLLHQYGNWRKQHWLVTTAVFISWYFSFLIVFILPLDVSGVSLSIFPEKKDYVCDIFSKRGPVNPLWNVRPCWFYFKWISLQITLFIISKTNVLPEQEDRIQNVECNALCTIQTFYRKCLFEAGLNINEQKRDLGSNSSKNSSVKNSSKTTPSSDCEKPWSYLPEHVLPDLWRVVYWSSQILSWWVQGLDNNDKNRTWMNNLWWLTLQIHMLQSVTWLNLG